MYYVFADRWPDPSIMTLSNRSEPDEGDTLVALVPVETWDEAASLYHRFLDGDVEFQSDENGVTFLREV